MAEKEKKCQYCGGVNFDVREEIDAIVVTCHGCASQTVTAKKKPKAPVKKAAKKKKK